MNAYITGDAYTDWLGHPDSPYSNTMFDKRKLDMCDFGAASFAELEAIEVYRKLP